ncbi:MAG: hypothetical protein RLN79_11140 [Cytophagales bacterium]
MSKIRRYKSRSQAMKYTFLSILFILNCLGSSIILAQSNIPVGSWRTHFSYYQIKAIEETNNYIYAAAENGLFRIDPETGLIDKISKIQGLNDNRISVLKYHKALSILIIAYESGNIDLVDKEGYIINIDAIIQSSAIVGSKRINHISIDGDFAFLSCSFGLVKLDLRKIEVAEDYRNLGLGNNSQIEIYASAVDTNGDSIYLSTSQGIMQAPFNSSVNLQDVNNWRLFVSADSVPQNNFSDLVSFDNSIFVARNSGNSAELWQYESGKWRVRMPGLGSQIKKLRIIGNQFILLTGNNIQLWNSTDTFSNVISELEIFPTPDDFLIDNNGKYWIASPDRGLISNLSGEYEYYNPNGPFKNLVARMAYNDGTLVVTSGGRKTNFTQQLNDFGYSIYENGEWINYLPKELPNTKNIGKFLLDLYEPYFYKSANLLALGSIGYGVLMQYESDSFQVFNSSNSTLFNILDGFASTRVSAMTENEKGELVMANTESPRPINFYSPENGWRSLPFSAQNLDRVDQMLTDEGNNIWCRVINITGGIIVFNEEDNQIRNLNAAEGNGNLPTNAVNDMAIDLDGDIWVGTNDGVAVFFNPDRIFDGGNVDASTPIFENRPLLREEIITSIEVDPANRKWVGTNNGVWLFEPDGTNVIANFTVDNSPLINNRIVDIEINEQNGEVFFATNDGIVSYRGTATSSNSVCDDIKVFPNPVKPGYLGDLSVYNIPQNAIVKIVDNGGKLFHEQRATGNSITWNLRSYNNSKPKSGVYYILTTTEDGEEFCNTKFAIIE